MFYLSWTILLLSACKFAYSLQSIPQLQISKDREAFFNKTSYVRIPALNFHNHIGLSFRTCAGGPLFVQSSSRSKISLNVTADGVVLSIILIGKSYETKVYGQYLDNSWHNVNIISRSANITLSAGDRQQVVANGTHNTELMSTEVTLSDGTSKVIIGEGFMGCMLEGPSLIFNASISEKHNVAWGPCPLPTGLCSPCKKAGNPCQNNARCEEDKLGNYACVCEAGFTGKLCQESIDQCQSSPCQHNATCLNRPNGGFTCNCAEGFTGHHCEADIDECKLNFCRHGHCVNSLGGYQCFCTPGFTGDHCEHDVDECLSHPCFNGATCRNEVNKFICICPPGFTGKDCRTNINECDSDPCLFGGTCIDGIAKFTCQCPPGLAGDVCDVNIDDCESSPCLNYGNCTDLVNKYTCNCTDTGFTGDRCEINIDDCVGNPCQNNATCEDMTKDYHCDCFAGYTGKNCEVDVNECESNPCQYNSTCLEHSNQSLYDGKMEYLPALYSHNFSYATAHGYECICVPGVTGVNCEIDIKECDSNPCRNGATCREEIGGYTCECGNGYEGTHCETEINECERYKPCIHGICREPRPAYYECDCSEKYGGKNCSVELIGCNQEPACLNNGTCIPYVLNEVDHRFNCTCPSGFHGPVCEKLTTMSLSGEGYIAVNTTRDEGYDISFRFKTTLPSGLLALGRGQTYFILELVNGRLNLHSSLLNKWDGVFVGSQLNNSEWQKVFVAINSSHVVLAANEEQTIYPIFSQQLESGTSYTTFPLTYVGGTVPNLRFFAHGPPMFIGCTENVIINGLWVLPEDKDILPIQLVNVDVGCQRQDQCSQNPCHSGGQCTDLWKTYSCTCQRPYLGNKCQYNLTAATFSHENITNSLVTVSVTNQAKKAIRSIVDLSMFIRTRQSKGAIFYLGSFPGFVPYADETHIAAKLDAGELFVKFQFNGTPESYAVGGVKLNDGYNHLIQVVRNVTLVQVKINGTEYFRKTIGSSGSLDAQVLYLGGFSAQSNYNDSTNTDQSTNESNRANRDAYGGDSITGDSHRSRLVRQTADKFENIPHFKGIIQDVQISNGSLIMAVEFYPLNVTDLVKPKSFGNVSFDPSTVLEGILSDNLCLSNPCANEAECSVTWNDYICYCTRGYKGKQCKEMEFCQLKNCPSDSVCRNLQHGYECVSNVTMNGALTNTSLLYSLVHKTENTIALNTIDITYRSKTGGTLLYLCNSEEATPRKHFYFFVFASDDVVTVAWKLDPNSAEQYQQIKKDNQDGDWTTINMKITDNKIQGSFAGVVDEPGQFFSSINFSSTAWNSIIMSGRIHIGGGDTFLQETLLSDKNLYYDGDSSNIVDSTISEIIPSAVVSSSVLVSLSNQTRNGVFYKGCVGEVRIGGILLPYFTENELNNSANLETSYFVLRENSMANTFDHSCYLCFETDCKNGGQCFNRKASYNCSCSVGFDGEDCSHDIDECANNRCVHGATCEDGVGNYTCRCSTGWSGWLCDQDIDECASQPCRNNGSCIDYLGYYKCNCTEDFVGKQCEQVKLVTCENKPCKNGANCIDTQNKNTGDNFTCSCLDGFIGTYCDQTFCSVTPCRNNGICTIRNKEPVCECGRGFQGRYCEENVNDCLPSRDGSPPCFHAGRCIDGIASFNCNCSHTGYKGERCEIDIDECEENLAECGEKGTCRNEDGGYKCDCVPDVCGYRCDLYDPCRDKPCQNGGTCQEECTTEQDYRCICPSNYAGKNCTEMQLISAESVVGIAKIVVPIVIVILVGIIVSVVMFFMMARNKRATRGTYSPSSQEYCNPRVELDNVMKPPPEERLI